MNTLVKGEGESMQTYEKSSNSQSVLDRLLCLSTFW